MTARRRTCDLTELVARVREVAPGTDPTLVAVSGFAASGKTTLATLLAGRLGTPVVVDVDHRLGLEARGPAESLPGSVRDSLAALVTSLRSGAAGVVVLEGRHLLHPEVAALFDVRVWIDLDLADARSHALGRKIAERRAAGETGPFGTWVAIDPQEPEPPPRPEQTFFDEHRPDRTAHALFVPVGRLEPPVEVRFLTESGCDFVLWDEDDALLGELEDLLPMPDGLRAELKAFAARAHALDSGEERLTAGGWRTFEDEGHRLSRALQVTLGPDWVVPRD